MKLLVTLTLSMSAIMPPVPDTVELSTVLFVLLMGLTMLSWLAHVSANCDHQKLPVAALWLAAFLVLVLLSALTAALHDTPFALWLRGAIPFLFLVFFLPVAAVARQDPGFVLQAILIASVAWLINIALQAGHAIPAVLSGDVQRITHATQAWILFQLPFAMLGLAIVLLHPPAWARPVRWMLAAGFSVVPILAVSRGQIVAVLAIWLYFVLRSKGSARLRTLLFFSGFAVVVGAFSADSNLLDSVVQRFAATAEGGESSRMAELHYAFARFLESPALGMGLGHQIPAQITFQGDFHSWLMAGADSVGYMHNVVGYLAMTLGLSGLVAYFGFVGAAVFRCRIRPPELLRSHVDMRTCALVVLALLLAWFMVQAAFRLIQCNLLLAAVLAALAARPSSSSLVR